MTPGEKNVVKSLIAVAWADGKVQDAESKLIDAMLDGFDADDSEAKELREWAGTQRSLDDIPLSELNDEEKELLLGNAAVLARADDEEATAETKLVADLAQLLGYADDERDRIVEASKDGALQLKSSALIPDDRPMPPSMRK